MTKSILKSSLLGVAALIVLLVLSFAAYLIYVTNSVDTINMPTNHGKVNATLFLTHDNTSPPAGAPKRPLIVALGGAEGGNVWATSRVRKLRNRFNDEGYAVLAVGYFGMPGTPEKLDRIALEGLHTAIMDAAKNPAIDGRCIAVMGGSKGGELALLLASRYPEIKSAAAIVPGNAVFVALTSAMTTSSFSHNGQALPFVPLPWRATPALITGDKRKVFEIMREDHAAVEQASIPVEKINGPVFLLSATQDEMWNSHEMSEQMMTRFKEKRFAWPHEHLAVYGGHDAPRKHMDRVLNFFNTHFKPGLADGCARAVSAG